jgi:hypothetical protein
MEPENQSAMLYQTGVPGYVRLVLWLSGPRGSN